MTNQISGKAILTLVKKDYKKFQEALAAKQKTIAIIRFLPSEENNEQDLR